VPGGKRQSRSTGATATARRRRGIYLLPNLFTTAALFAGFYAIVAAMNGDYTQAAAVIFIAGVLDGIDGRVARLTNTHSDFGKEYDSLADMVSFGLAPALVIYVWGLAEMSQYGWHWAKVGWLAAFVYAAGSALRLARFNTQSGSPDKRYFLGLPSPAAAAVVAGLVWVCVDAEVGAGTVVVPALLVTVAAGLLMVSNVSYYSFKDIDFGGRVPFRYMLLVVLAFILIAINPPRVLFTAFLLYMLSGPLLLGYRRLRDWRRRRRRGA